jgi:hypothetical protein
MNGLRSTLQSVLSKEIGEWKDEPTKNLGIFLFGVSKPRNQFQVELVESYLEILPLVKRVKKMEAINRVKPFIEFLQTVCRTDPPFGEMRLFYECTAWDLLTKIKELVLLELKITP